MVDKVDVNKSAFAKWKANTLSNLRARFVAFIDGDDVEQGNDFTTVAINASELASQRGNGANIAVYDAKSGKQTPH